MKTKLTLLIAITIMATTQIALAQNTKSRTFNVPTFTVINANIVGDVIYTHSANAAVEAKGDEKMIENLQVTVENGVLNLRRDKKLFERRKSRRGKLTVYVSSPVLKEVRSNGVGDILLNDKIETEHFIIQSKGVGDVDIKDINCNEITIQSTGVGDVKVKGTTGFLTLVSSGVGDTNAKYLIAENAEVTSKGVGDVTCHVTGSLDLKKTGVGDVRYFGEPTIKKLRTSGPGSIKSGN